MLKGKYFLLIAILACFFSSLGAQTYSPYTRYGYGVLKDQAVGPSKSMGGVGYGLRNSQSANPLNPASYSRIDSLTFLFDIGVSFNRGKLSDATNSQSKNGGGLDYITMLVPLTKGLGFSFGILPFSSVGYQFGSTETTGSLSYTKAYTGSGGFSQAYLGLGYLTPLKGLSLGLNASYLFGTIEHTRNLPAITSSTVTSMEYTELSVKGVKLDIGLQYEFPISKRDKIVLGAVYSPKINTKADYEMKYYEISSSALIRGDTVSVKGVDAGIPETYGLGLTYNRKNNLVIGADVTYQKWENVKYSSLMGDGLSTSERFNDRWKYAVGAEYMINPFERSFIKKMKFRGGFNYSNSYQNVISTDGQIGGYKEYGATVGFGLPIRDNIGERISYININFEYKKIKPKFKNLITEEYFGVSLNVNINEFWFFRKVVY